MLSAGSVPVPSVVYATAPKSAGQLRCDEHRLGRRVVFADRDYAPRNARTQARTRYLRRAVAGDEDVARLDVPAVTGALWERRAVTKTTGRA